MLDRLSRHLIVVLIGLLGSMPVASADPPPVLRGQAGWLYPGWELRPPADPTPSVRLIAQAHAAMAKRGIALLVALTPSKVRIHPEYLPQDYKLPMGQRDSYDRLIDDLTRAGVATADLRKAMLADKPRQGQFHKADSHWTTSAARISAQSIGDKLQGTPSLAPSKATPPPLPRLVSIQHRGDLIPLLTGISEAERGQLSETIQVYRDQANSRLLMDDDELPYDVAVVGTSFAQPHWGLSQNLAQVLARPVGLAYKMGNYGHWNILLEYLRGAEFKTNRPRVIIWQMTETALPSLPDANVWQRSHADLTPALWLQQLEQALP